LLPRVFSTPLAAPCSNYSSEAVGVSRDGRFAVGYEEEQYPIAGSCVLVRRAVRWPLGVVGGGPLVLDPDSPFATVARAASADGSVVVGEQTFTLIVNNQVRTFSEMFRWTAQTGVVGLGSLTGTGSSANTGMALDVSADGRIVVGVSGGQAAIWDQAHGLRSMSQALADAGISTSTWQLLSADAISGDGRVIVGYGFNPERRYEAWRAQLPARCTGDFNGSGQVTLQDIFDFLGAFFAGAPSADVNHNGSVTLQDVFDFLTAWFAGC
jgi:uncharacterized membrane protein